MIFKWTQLTVSQYVRCECDDWEQHYQRRERTINFYLTSEGIQIGQAGSLDSSVVLLANPTSNRMFMHGCCAAECVRPMRSLLSYKTPHYITINVNITCTNRPLYHSIPLNHLQLQNTIIELYLISMWRRCNAHWPHHSTRLYSRTCAYSRTTYDPCHSVTLISNIIVCSAVQC